MLCSKLLIITEAMNNHEQFTPKVPIQQELDSVYDTSITDVQPFLFKVVQCTCISKSIVKLEYEFDFHDV